MAINARKKFFLAFLISFSAFQISFVCSFQNALSFNKNLYFPTLILSALSIFFWHNLINKGEIEIKNKIILKLIVYLIIFQDILIVSEFYSAKVAYLLHIINAVYIFMNQTKNYFYNFIKKKFFDNSSYNYFKDIIILEKYFMMTKSQCSKPSDKETTEYLLSNSTNLDSRFYFSILSSEKNENSSDIEKSQILSRKKLENFDLPNNRYSNNLNEQTPDNSIENLSYDDEDISFGFFEKNKSENEKAKYEPEFENKSISVESISRIFPIKEAKVFFKIISHDFDKELKFLDFHDSIRQINNERNTLRMSLRNSKKTMETFKTFLNLTETFVLFGLFAVLFDVLKDLGLMLTPVLLFLIPIVLNLSSSFIFLIYLHPYDIGDRIYIENENLIVKDIGFTNTVFEKWNNECVIISNDYIKKRSIHNIRRSKSQQWKVEFLISSKIDTREIEKLNERMKLFVFSQPEFENFSYVIDRVEKGAFMMLNFIIKHSINHQNGFYMWKVQNKFMRKLLEECEISGLEFIPNKLNFKK